MRLGHDGLHLLRQQDSTRTAYAATRRQGRYVSIVWLTNRLALGQEQSDALLPLLSSCASGRGGRVSWLDEKVSPETMRIVFMILALVVGYAQALFATTVRLNLVFICVWMALLCFQYALPRAEWKESS